MKAKKILSMVIAAAMTMQCVVISAAASETDTGVTVVASDSSTDWTMGFNNWERIEAAFKHHSSWSVKNGLKLNHDNDKYQELNKVAYYIEKDSSSQWTQYSATKPSGDFQMWFNTDASGNPVAYGTEGSTAQLWYRKDRHFYTAQFTAGETVSDQRPAVISFTYRTTNPATNFYGNEPATAYEILCNQTKSAFRIFPNYSGNGLQIAYYDVSANSTAYKQLGVPKDNAEHDIKVVISPELNDGRYQMEAISVDGAVTKLENVYGLTAGMTDMLIYGINYKSGMNVSSSYEDEIKNLTIQRGIDDISVSSSVADGATDVTPENITLTFSDAVGLAEGAVKVYENGTEMTSSYTAEQGSDNKTVTVNIQNYKSRTAYKIAVDNTLVSGLLGGEQKEAFEVNFVTSKKVTVLEGSENLASGYTVEPYGYGPNGQDFTTVTTDADGVTTITIDNDTWAKAADANTDKSGNQEWVYGVDEKGNDITVGYASWNFTEVDIKGFTDIKQSTDPIVISMDYAFENMQSNGDNNDMWIKTGDTANQMYYFTVFGDSPAVSGVSWGGEAYASGIKESDWHSVQYVIDPTIDENEKTHISQITIDKEVVKDTAQKWVSYKTADDTDEYINKIEMRIKRQTATDENGKLLPTVLKIKNFKLLRAEDFNVAVDTDALTNTENTLAVRFSDPVAEGELANLKVMRGTEVVENAISAASLAEDGLSAKLTLTLDTTAIYTLVTSEVADIYGVKSSTAPVEFEYYNTSDGYVTITETSMADDGTDTTVSFTFTSSKTVSPTVIVAAYDEACSLIGVGMKKIDLTSTADVSDSITLEKLTGADKIQVMAWDSFENMKPYCLAKTIN